MAHTVLMCRQSYVHNSSSRIRSWVGFGLDNSCKSVVFVGQIGTLVVSLACNKQTKQHSQPLPAGSSVIKQTNEETTALMMMVVIIKRIASWYERFPWDKWTIKTWPKTWRLSGTFSSLNLHLARNIWLRLCACVFVRLFGVQCKFKLQWELWKGNSAGG